MSVVLSVEYRSFLSNSFRRHPSHALEKSMRITGQLLRSRSKRPLHIVRYIDLSSCNIVTLDHLRLCPKLTTLVARNNQLESIPNLDCCPQLWKVDLAHNKLQCLNGFSRFSVLGSLVLSNNCLDWNHLEKLCHIHILELSLHGNPKLEKEPYYRMHIIDSLPLLWMLDGRLITSAERRQVYRFFKESELTDRPVRHKLSKKRFTPTSLKNLPVTGVFGEKTEHWMKRFPLHEKLSKELDRRRLQYLAYNLKGNVQLQSTYVDGGENNVCEDLFVEVVKQRENDKERSNMLLLLLVGILEFHIPEDVIKQTLEITKLNKIGSFNTKEIFSLPRKHQCSLASLLLAGVKIDRDANIADGLYDTLYLSLHDLVSEWHRLSNGDNITRKSGVRDVLAAEIVQLFCIVPAFLMLLGKDAGLLDLVSSATKDPEIGEHLCDILWKEEVKGGNIGNIFQELGSYVLKKVHTRHSQPGKSGINTSSRLERTHSPLRTSSYTKTGESPKRAHSAFDAARQNTRKVKSTDDENKKSGRAFSPRKSGRSAVKRIALGDKVITGDQVSGNIVALPDKGIALVRQDIIPGRRYPQLDLVKKRYIDNCFIYVDTQMLQWHHQGFWILRENNHEIRDDEVQTHVGSSENNSETFLTRTVRKQLPLEVWMSFSTENSTAKPETDTSESGGTVITKHVRELVKECIREAKETNEITEQPEVQLEPAEKHNVQFIETEPTLNNFEDAIQNKEEQRLCEQDYDEEENGWEDLMPDEDMISKTENDRLDAWKFFHLRSLEERIITDKNRRTSVTQPCPRSSLEQNSFIAPRTGNHESLLPKEVYTISGKRLSFPLPGWMEELHLRNHRRSHSSSACSPRKHQHDLEIKGNWTPIIFPAPVARSVGFPPPHVTGESNYDDNFKYTRKRWPKRHQSAQAILKRK